MCQYLQGLKTWAQKSNCLNSRPSSSTAISAALRRPPAYLKLHCHIELWELIWVKASAGRAFNVRGDTWSSLLSPTTLPQVLLILQCQGRRHFPVPKTNPNDVTQLPVHEGTLAPPYLTV